MRLPSSLISYFTSKDKRAAKHQTRKKLICNVRYMTLCSDEWKYLYRTPKVLTFKLQNCKRWRGYCTWLKTPILYKTGSVGEFSQFSPKGRGLRSFPQKERVWYNRGVILKKGELLALTKVISLCAVFVYCYLHHFYQYPLFFTRSTLSVESDHVYVFYKWAIFEMQRHCGLL